VTDLTGPDLIDNVARAVAEGLFASRATMVAGPEVGSSALVVDGQVVTGSLPPPIAEQVLADAAELLRREQSLTLRYEEHHVYVESIVPAPRLVIFGAVHIAQELAAMAPRLGFAVTISDARAAFTTRQRFPDVEELLVGWPDEVVLDYDRRTYVVVLSHDARFEDPLWPRVLASPVPYIGAMGSAKTARRRRQKLAEQGFPAEEIDRIHGPIGLKIGAESPAEVAVAILAEIIATRHRFGETLSLNGIVEGLPEA
jgi:xanthine dehydrogenase accessory factor